VSPLPVLPLFKLGYEPSRLVAGVNLADCELR
jgi:hypothetical protein